MKLKAIIIDDEKHGQETLSRMLTDYCKNVEVLAVADSISSGIAVINKYQPNLVFLDIVMPMENGLTLFEYFEKPDFDVIFTTAFDKFAVKAFRLSAIDFLLKPIDLEELREAISRATIKKSSEEAQVKLEILQSNFNNTFNKLTLPTKDGYVIVELEDIIRCEAQGNYSLFHLKNGDKIITSKTLKLYDDLLKEFNFFRTNRSNIVNLNHIKKYGKNRNTFVTMSDGTTLSLSEGRRSQFIKIIEGKDSEPNI